MTAPYILPMELDEKSIGSEMKQVSDVIPSLQLFSFTTLIILAKLLRVYQAPGSLVYNPTQLILTNPKMTYYCYFVHKFQLFYFPEPQLPGGVGGGG